MPSKALTKTAGSVGFSLPVMVLALTALALSACSKNETATSPAAPPSQSTPSSAGTTQPVASTASYRLGTQIQFGTAGGSEQYRSSGWSVTEADHTWTEGSSATLAFTGLPTSEPLQLQMTLAGSIKAPQLPSQPVEVSANGQKIADWQVAEKQTYTAAIPGDAIREGGNLELQFRIPQATAPKSLGINEDPRVLGIECFDLVIDKSH